VIVGPGIRALIVVAVSIVNDNIIPIDALLPVAMVSLLRVAAGERRCGNERNEADLNVFGSLRHLSNGGDNDGGDSQQDRRKLDCRGDVTFFDLDSVVDRIQPVEQPGTDIETNNTNYRPPDNVNRPSDVLRE